MRYFINNLDCPGHYYAINDAGEGFYVMSDEADVVCPTDAVDCRVVLNTYETVSLCKLRKVWKRKVITKDWHEKA